MGMWRRVRRQRPLVGRWGDSWRAAEGANGGRQWAPHEAPQQLSLRAAATAAGGASWDDFATGASERILVGLWGQNSGVLSTGQLELMLPMRAGDTLAVALRRHSLSALRGDTLTSFSGHLLARFDSDQPASEGPTATSDTPQPFSTTSEPPGELRENQQQEELSEPQSGNGRDDAHTGGDNDVEIEPN